MRLRAVRQSDPFDFSRGAPAPGRYPADRLNPTQAVEAIRHAPVEVGYGFDARVRQVFRQVGDRSWIAGISPSDLRAIADGTFIHCHPPYAEFPVGDPRRRAGSFSSTDLALMVEYDLAEMVAVTVERTYVARRPPGGFYLDPEEVLRVYASLVSEIELRLHSQVEAGIIASEVADARGSLADEVMERLRAYYDYRWEEAR